MAGATGNADMRGLVQTLADAGVQRLVLLSGSSAEDGDPGNAVSEYVAEFPPAPRTATASGV